MKRYKISTIIITVIGLVLFVSIAVFLVMIAVLGWKDVYIDIDNILAVIFAMLKFLSTVSIPVLILIILVCVIANRFFGKSYRLKIPLVLLIAMTALYLVLIPITNFFPIVMHDMPPLQLPPDIPSDYFERMQNK